MWNSTTAAIATPRRPSRSGRKRSGTLATVAVMALTKDLLAA